MANQTLTGCIDFGTGLAKFDQDDCEYSGCLVIGGVHDKQVAVTIGTSFCDDIYYGCVEFPGGTFKVYVPDDCCEVVSNYTRCGRYIYDKIEVQFSGAELNECWLYGFHNNPQRFYGLQAIGDLSVDGGTFELGNRICFTDDFFPPSVAHAPLADNVPACSYIKQIATNVFYIDQTSVWLYDCVAVMSFCPDPDPRYGLRGPYNGCPVFNESYATQEAVWKPDNWGGYTLVDGVTFDEYRTYMIVEIDDTSANVIIRTYAKFDGPSGPIIFSRGLFNAGSSIGYHPGQTTWEFAAEGFSQGWQAPNIYPDCPTADEYALQLSDGDASASIHVPTDAVDWRLAFEAIPHPYLGGVHKHDTPCPDVFTGFPEGEEDWWP